MERKKNTLRLVGKSALRHEYNYYKSYIYYKIHKKKLIINTKNMYICDNRYKTINFDFIKKKKLCGKFFLKIVYNIYNIFLFIYDYLFDPNLF